MRLAFEACYSLPQECDNTTESSLPFLLEVHAKAVIESCRKLAGSPRAKAMGVKPSAK